MEIIFSEGTAILSKVIMAAQGFKKSHMAMRYSGVESDWIVESSTYGVRPDWYSFFMKEHPSVIRFEVLIDPKIADSCLDEVVHELGHKSYDILGLMGAGVVLLWKRITGKRIQNPLDNKKIPFCSQVFGAWLFKVSSLTSAPFIDPSTYDLKEIYEYLKSHPALFKEIP